MIKKSDLQVSEVQRVMLKYTQSSKNLTLLLLIIKKSHDHIYTNATESTFCIVVNVNEHHNLRIDDS